MIAGWIEREQRARPRLYLRRSEPRRLSLPHRIPLHQGEYRTAEGAAADADHGVEGAGRGARLSADLLLAEYRRAGLDCRSRSAAEMTANWSLAQMSLRGTPRAPQRVSFAADKMTVDRSGARQAGARVHGGPCRTARPDRLRHGDGKSGDRYCDLACRGKCARPSSAGDPAARSQCRYAACGPEEFRAETLGGPLSRDPAGRRSHRGAQLCGRSRAICSRSRAAR